MINLMYKYGNFLNAINSKKLIKLRFDFEETWGLYPLVYATEDEMGLIAGDGHAKEVFLAHEHQNIVLKTSSFDKEYFVICKFKNFSKENGKLVLLTNIKCHY
jgi:hypothetical protein